MKISVVIHTYNAESSLESVLKTLLDYDEILICDMYSTDRTIEIAEKYNCRIIYHKYTGYVEPARQYSTSNAKYDWILMVDSDECIPPTLKNYLIDTVNSNPDVSAIRIPRKNYFLGRFMHGAYPDYITRFFKKDKIVWSDIIHSTPKITGETFLIPKDRKDLAFLHNGTPTLAYNIYKMNNYTNAEVEKRINKPHGYFSILFSPLSRILKHYILRGGFKDGVPGLICALEYCVYKFYALAKTYESEVKIDDYDPEFKSYFEGDLRRIEKEKEMKE